MEQTRPRQVLLLATRFTERMNIRVCPMVLVVVGEGLKNEEKYSDFPDQDDQLFPESGPRLWSRGAGYWERRAWSIS
jgi:hypothetical protein